MNNDNLSAWLQSRKRMREQRNAPELLSELLKGNQVALSASITLLESTLPSDQLIARELIQAALPHAGNSIRIGITGVPGVGKSTFIEAFGLALTAKGKRLAVLAVDPSSERTGGSILGDKTRMETLSNTEHVFIRPSAAGNALGGVARKTRESILLCEAAGFDVILIETVGVGQSEIMVHSMVDFFLLLLLAGAGDELQGIKRGIMEMADGLVVTKADSGNEQKAEFAKRELKNALHLFPPTTNGWIPEVITASAVEGKNIDVVVEMIERFERHNRLNGHFVEHRKSQDSYWMHETLKGLLLEGLYSNEALKTNISTSIEAIAKGTMTAFDAADYIYKTYLDTKK